MLDGDIKCIALPGTAADLSEVVLYNALDNFPARNREIRLKNFIKNRPEQLLNAFQTHFRRSCMRTPSETLQRRQKVQICAQEFSEDANSYVKKIGKDKLLFCSHGKRQIPHRPFLPSCKNGPSACRKMVSWRASRYWSCEYRN